MTDKPQKPKKESPRELESMFGLDKLSAPKTGEDISVKNVMKRIHADEIYGGLIQEGSETAKLIESAAEKLLQKAPAKAENADLIATHMLEIIGHADERGELHTKAFQKYLPRSEASIEATTNFLTRDAQERESGLSNRINTDSIPSIAKKKSKFTPEEEKQIDREVEIFKRIQKSKEKEANRLTRSMKQKTAETAQSITSGIHTTINVGGLALGLLGMANSFNQIDGKDNQGNQQTNWSAAAIFAMSGLVAATSGLSLIASHGRGR